MSSIAILGAGSWGTAIAIHLAESGHHVLLWGRNPTAIRNMVSDQENKAYLPGYLFPDTLIPTADLSRCIEQADHLIIAVPSHAFASILAQIPKPTQGIAWLTKGIEPVHCTLLSDLIAQQWGTDYPIAIIAGPSFAKEVAQHLPTALVIAGNNPAYANTIRHLFHQRTLRTYLSQDIIGVQLCGAIKNVLAIACGVSDGLGFGTNTIAALITRGLAEMTLLGTHLGGQADTFVGLAGLGDLVLTCTDNQSRNRRFGRLLGQGLSIVDAEKQVAQVVEGKSNAAQICLLAAQHKLDLPICMHVNALVHGKISAKEAATALMNRPLRED